MWRSALRVAERALHVDVAIADVGEVAAGPLRLIAVTIDLACEPLGGAVEEEDVAQGAVLAHVLIVTGAVGVALELRGEPREALGEGRELLVARVLREREEGDRERSEEHCEDRSAVSHLGLLSVGYPFKWQGPCQRKRPEIGRYGPSGA